MRSSIKLAFAAVAALAFSAGAASATTYSVTYTGTVTGTDTAGLFGPVNTVLNDAFTAVFTYDPTLFGTASRTTDANSDYAIGGSQKGTTSPLLSDSLTINGTSISLDVSQYSEAQAEGGPSSARDPNPAQTLLEIIRTYSGSNLSAVLAVGIEDSTLAITPDLTVVQSYSSPSNSFYGGLVYGGDSLNLYANAAQVAAAQVPAPEPGSLALLAGAAGLLGLAARRRPEGRTGCS